MTNSAKTAWGSMPRLTPWGSMPRLTWHGAQRGPVVTRLENMYMPPDPTPRIMVLFGRRKRGKSLTAVFLARLIRDLTLKRTGKKRPVLSNLNSLTYADRAGPEVIEAMMKYPKWAFGAIAVVDEITELSISKRAMATRAIELESWLTMIRKTGIDLIATSQFPNRLTTPVRDQVDFFVYPTLRKWYDGERTRVAVHTAWYDWHGSVTGRPHHAADWPPWPEEADSVRSFDGLERAFDWYDTDEIVINPYLPYAEELRKRMGGKYAKQKLLNRIFGDRAFMDAFEYVDALREMGAETADDLRDISEFLNVEIRDGMAYRP